MALMAGALQLILLFIFIGIAVVFLLTQQGTLNAIRPENRRMKPGMVWLQLIPFFGLIYQFWVIRRIADSIRNELNTPTGDTIFAEDGEDITSSPTYALGISYAILFCCTILPLALIKGLFFMAGMVVWICYWFQLNRYRIRLKRRLMLQ